MGIDVAFETGYTNIAFGIGIGKTSLYVGKDSLGISATFLFWTIHFTFTKEESHD